MNINNPSLFHFFFYPFPCISSLQLLFVGVIVGIVVGAVVGVVVGVVACCFHTHLLRKRNNCWRLLGLLLDMLFGCSFGFRNFLKCVYPIGGGSCASKNTVGKLNTADSSIMDFFLDRARGVSK